MKRAVCIAGFVLILSCAPALSKTINPPSADIADVIVRAQEYLKTRHIDLSHRFLAAVEYKNIHSEYERPYWLLTWALLAGTSEGQFYVESSTLARSMSHAPTSVFVRQGSNQSLEPPAGRREVHVGLYEA